MEIRDIYLYLCMYSFFYGTFTRVSTNNLDSVMNGTFDIAGIALTNATDSNIAHTLREKPDRISWKYKKNKKNGTQRLEVRII